MTNWKKQAENLAEALKLHHPCCGCDHPYCKLCSRDNIIESVLADYEASKKVEIPEGAWIEWSGGECPVPMGTLVDVVHRNGDKAYNQPAGAEDGYAEDWGWVDNHSGDIIRYRIVPKGYK